MTTKTSGYYAPLTPARLFDFGAWHIAVGTTPDGRWVAEYTSTAAPRPQRKYFDTEAEAVADAERFCRR